MYTTAEGLSSPRRAPSATPKSRRPRALGPARLAASGRLVHSATLTGLPRHPWPMSKTKIAEFRWRVYRMPRDSSIAICSNGDGLVCRKPGRKDAHRLLVRQTFLHRFCIHFSPELYCSSYRCPSSPPMKMRPAATAMHSIITATTGSAGLGG